jgi:type III secretion system FlhB-like substrate exporter
MSIETIYGTNAKLSLVSQQHGSIRVPLNQNFDYTPRFTSKTIFEFDRTDAALVVSLFEGADVRFEYLDTESKLVDSCINDVDPASAIVVDDPATYSEINIYLNIKNSLGKIFQSVLAMGVKVKGSATTEPVRDESRITRDCEALNVLRIKGGAIEYTRAKTAASTAFAQGTANNSTDVVAAPSSPVGSSIVTLAHEPEVARNTNRYLVILLNGTDISEMDSPPTVVFSGVDNTTVTVTPNLEVTDVLELFTVYIPA